MARRQAPSYEKIDYTIRPAKYIERKMLCAALQRLSPFGPIEQYRYVGFGSIYFSDFSLLHRTLGIVDMRSIEHAQVDGQGQVDQNHQFRFEFNRPFACVEVVFGESGELLREERWSKKCIIWLDYDKQLQSSMLDDLEYCFSEAKPGSIIIVSVNADAVQRGDNYDDEGSTYGKRLEKRLGDEYNKLVPSGLVNKNFAGWGMGEICARIINNHIEQTVARTNDRHGEEKLAYKPLFNFQYKDGVRMLTVGGLLYERSDAEKVQQCTFEGLDFMQPWPKRVVIEVPMLTHRELRQLDRFMPDPDARVIASLKTGIPYDDLKNYAAIYRYFPSFAAVDL